jgi:hypothetical protein
VPFTIAPAPPTLRRSPAHGARPAIAVAARPATLPHLAVPRIAVPLIAVALIASLALGAIAALAPSPVLGATSMTARCDGVSLRTKPKATATRKARINEGADVVAVAIVRGGRWTTKCDGSSSTGRSWYRIASVNGKSVSRLYGRTYVYAATSLLRVTSAPVTKQAACGVRLRTGTSTDATAKARLAAGTKVTVMGSFTAAAEHDLQRRRPVGPRLVPGHRRQRQERVLAVRRARPVRGQEAVAHTEDLQRGDPDADAHPDLDARLHRGHRRQPLAGDHQLVQGRGRRQEVRVHEGLRGQELRRPTYATNRAQAKSNGLHVGAYHFARPGEASPPDGRGGPLHRPPLGQGRDAAGARSRDSGG